MEWVETTGKTVEDAKDAALDQLGVDEQDAEFEIVEEPRTGLFGRTRGDARVRARVRPTQPRPKVERRDRKGRGKGGRPGEQRGKRAAATPARSTADDAGVAVLDASADEPAPARSAGRPGGRDRPAAAGRRRGGARGRDRDTDDNEEIPTMTETELLEQGEVVQTFLMDLLDAFGLAGDVSVTPAEEGAVELKVTGDDLGLLIGPKGQTLQAVQELSRSVLQRQLPGESHARIRVDVGGYRQRRKEALERFVRQIAEDVRSSGVQKALEPMSPPDRKVVHDTVNEIDGVRTMSEGEDTRRRVVILPDS
jgi:spoIIIJ-associated protein